MANDTFLDPYVAYIFGGFAVAILLFWWWEKNRKK